MARAAGAPFGAGCIGGAAMRPTAAAQRIRACLSARNLSAGMARGSSTRSDLHQWASVSLRQALVIGLLALGAGVWLGAAAPTVAAPLPLSPTVITAVQVPTSVVVGSKVPLQVRITTPDGSPVADARVLLTLDGTLLRGDRSDQTGLVSLDLRDTEVVTAHTAVLLFTFAGDRSHGASTLTRNLVLAAAALRVTTVPAVAGIHFTLGALTATSGADGVATILVPAVGSYTLTPSFDQPVGATTRISFLRWQDGVFTPARNVHVTGDETLVLGLRQAVQASIRLVDESGAVVPPGSIDSMSLSSSDGQTITITSLEGLWWISATATSRPEGLASVETVYRVNDVMIAGTNVVNAGQTTWSPEPGAVLTVPVLLFQLQVSTRDAFFGWALEGPLELVYPDQSVARATVGPSGDVDFGTLPRGSYTLKFHTQGLSPPTPVALSRSQTALIRIVTYLDIAVTVMILLVIAVLLVVLGRRHQLAHAYERARASAGDPRPAQAVERVTGPLTGLAAELDRALGLGRLGPDPAVAPSLLSSAPSAGNVTRRRDALRARADRLLLAAADRLGRAGRSVSDRVDTRVVAGGPRLMALLLVTGAVIIAIVVLGLAVGGALR